jgi:DNA-binding transcriptional regulator of glucitol operon
MWGWQGILALLAVAWLLQCAGTLIQIQRYRGAFRELSSTWSDGWMGAGRGGRFLQAGSIAMIVVSPDERVRRVVAITGRTVFARAERIELYEGLTPAALRAEAERSPKRPVSIAMIAALDQIETVRGNQAARASSMPDVPALA